MITELEKLLKEATPGPWEVSGVAVTDRMEDLKLMCFLLNNAEKLLAVVKAAKNIRSYFFSDNFNNFVRLNYRDWMQFESTLKDLDTSPEPPQT